VQDITSVSNARALRVTTDSHQNVKEAISKNIFTSHLLQYHRPIANKQIHSFFRLVCTGLCRAFHHVLRDYKNLL